MNNKTILICGANGMSGRAAASLCFQLGARVLLSDQKPFEHEILSDHRPCRRLIDLCPRQDAAILYEYDIDFIIQAPGISHQIELLQKAAAQGILIRSENDFGFEMLMQKAKEKNKKLPYVFAVTGTDGKSTCTALLTALIHRTTSYQAIACGNYGLPLSKLALDSTDYDVLIVECSSFQLEQTQEFHPHTALFLNLDEDHMDRYEQISDYFQAKLNISYNQTQQDLLIVPEKLKDKIKKELHKKRNTSTNHPLFQPRLTSISAAALSDLTSPLSFQNHTLAFPKELKLPGLHNIENIRFCLAALQDFSMRLEVDIDPKQLHKELLSFRGLEHRLEYVDSIALANGLCLLCYNDSKATTVQAVLAALHSFPKKHIFLLCGGRYKGGDFRQLRAEFISSLSIEKLDIFPFGEAADLISKQTKSQYSFQELERAFEAILNIAENYPKGQISSIESGHPQECILLLSPGCASFDAFLNYTQRGKYFRKLVRQRKSQA